MAPPRGIERTTSTLESEIVILRSDLARVERSLRSERTEQRIDATFSAMEARLREGQRSYVLILLGSNSVFVVVAFVLLRLTLA